MTGDISFTEIVPGRHYNTFMHDDMITTLTERGQTSVPARFRREANMTPGQKLRWERVSDTVFRVAVETAEDAPGPLAALGWARRFSTGPLPRSDDVIRELREGDAE
jgi:bifunctional DNA-binding transcriptional regulator/antitoxin component of YhaV-PrlF toxin-antitoxin module